jgi:hypothetical protein
MEPHIIIISVSVTVSIAALVLSIKSLMLNRQTNKIWKLSEEIRKKTKVESKKSITK